MCQLLAISSPYPVQVNDAFRRFARHGSPDCPDHDGWGIAYYQEGDVRVVRDSKPAACSSWAGFVKGLSVQSPLVIGHLRHASAGDVALRNTHPFVRELGGRYHIFAHNGTVPGVFNAQAFHPHRFHPLGETDSEWAFCTLMEQLAEAWCCAKTIPPLPQRTDIVAAFAAKLRELGPANFIYTDGDALFLHGDRRQPSPGQPAFAPGLHFRIERSGDRSPVLTASDLTTADTPPSVFVAASLPLTAEAWTPMSTGELLVVRHGRIDRHTRT